MHPGELAHYRIEDMVREAERYRLARGMKATGWGSKGRARRVLATVISTVLGPLRH